MAPQWEAQFEGSHQSSFEPNLYTSPQKIAPLRTWSLFLMATWNRVWTKERHHQSHSIQILRVMEFLKNHAPFPRVMEELHYLLTSSVWIQLENKTLHGAEIRWGTSSKPREWTKDERTTTTTMMATSTRWLAYWTSRSLSNRGALVANLAKQLVTLFHGSLAHLWESCLVLAIKKAFMWTSINNNK